jgi:hypothetical protein
MVTTYCPVIVGLKLDEESQKAVEDINHIHDVTKLGKATFFIGQLLGIFGGKVVKPQSSGISLLEDTLTWKVVSSDITQDGWAVYQTNWEIFFQTFSSLDAHARRQIETIAGIQVFRTWKYPKQQAFWRAIYEGCKLK